MLGNVGVTFQLECYHKKLHQTVAKNNYIAATEYLILERENVLYMLLAGGTASRERVLHILTANNFVVVNLTAKFLIHPCW